MNRTTIIALVLLGLAVVIILGTMFLVFRTTKEAATPSEGTAFPTTGGFPSGFTTTSTVTIAGKDGSSIEVNDFIHNGETIEDVVNPGSYVLAGDLGYCLVDGSCPVAAETDRFSVSYDQKSQSFGVALLKEPLSEVRLEVEAFLTSRLGISKQQLCSLNYYIGTPYWVNERFSEGNLGFSACTESVTLP